MLHARHNARSSSGFSGAHSREEREVLGHRVGWAGEVLTQQQVASRLGVSQAHVSNVERRLQRRMKDLRRAEQEALEKLPENRALKAAEVSIREALDRVEAVRKGDFSFELRV